MEAPYRPISCSFYDELALRAMRGSAVEIVYVTSEGETERIRDVIADIFTQGEAEYLRLASGPKLRLDALREVDGLSLPDAC